jgi:hypothetical protein
VLVADAIVVRPDADEAQRVARLAAGELARQRAEGLPEDVLNASLFFAMAPVLALLIVAVLPTQATCSLA